jgi:hypothetical protein
MTLLVLVTAAMCGCGATGDPRTQAVDAAKSTLNLSGTSYDVLLTGQRLSGPSVELPGGKAAYDLRAGVGYEALTMQRRGGSNEKLFLDFVPTGVAVAPWPTPAGILPAGKIWVSVGLTGKGAPAQGDLLPAQLEELSPELALDEIAWGATSVTSLGTPTINHVPMHEYRVTIDLAKALAAAAKSRKPAIAAAIASERHAFPSGRKTVDIWVTGAGHVGKIELTIPRTKLPKVDFQFTSFHAQFKRATPPASQSIPISAIGEPSSSTLWPLVAGS